MILINGEFPGPLLELTEGDDVVVEVSNGLDDESAIHFHGEPLRETHPPSSSPTHTPPGIEMIDTPWSDGTPGLSQRPIPPGESFTYRWKAAQYGSYWYHSHSHEQVEDGCYGPVAILPRADTPKPFGLISNRDAAIGAMERAEQEAKTVIMSDHRHVSGHTAWELTQRARFDPACWDSILVNGKGRVHCMERGEAEALLSEDQREMLAELNATMTDKG
ncbi:MAG: multicopper oxidase domain-containing protein [Acidobacteria bacterium]|nr:multicopper oxidase domain-containing protein [Acidobacteriota bacterium]